ncbi:DNA-directed RNA polymerase subunit omega [Sedimentibacter sp.]|uniref:DNA-directed RNA polymerase subunit omega n=1 Tax=Sedimentibacter sp. TaxID=1960295 RepID=UPI003995F5ED
MRKISVDELIDMVDSRYSLVTIISKRARQIIDGSDILIKTPTNKPVAIAIEEFYDRKYEAIYNFDQYKKNAEKTAADEADDANSKHSTENEGLEEQTEE